MRTMRTIIVDMANRALRSAAGALFAPRWVSLFLAWTLFAAAVRPAGATFDDMGAGARAPGMADAHTSVADDANALHYNPAGLGQLSETEVTSEYGQLLKGTDDGSNLGTTYLGFAQPFKRGRRGTLAFGFHNFKASNLLSERTLSLSYGRTLAVVPFGFRGTFSAGATVKQLHRQYQPDRFTENALNDAGTGTGSADPLFANSGYTKDAYSVDLGSLYRFGPDEKFSGGLVFKNVNRPDVSLAGDGDKAPFITKLGFGYHPRWGLLTGEIRRARRLASRTDLDVALGAERNFTLADIGTLSFRGGYAEGSRGFKAITAGVSYKFTRAQIDYAFNFPVGNLSDTQGSHRIGLSMRMTAAKPEDAAGDARPASDLLIAFLNDSTASHLVISRLVSKRQLGSHHQTLLLKLLANKYTGQDEGALTIRKNLMARTDEPVSSILDAGSIVYGLLKNVRDEDVPNAAAAVNQMMKGDNQNALARMTLLSPASRRDAMMTAVALVAHTELSARAYRAGALTNAIEHLRQIVELLSDDDVVMRAYREMLLEQAARTQSSTPVDVSTRPAVSNEMPEAPATLVAPAPVAGETPVKESDLEILSKAYGSALGYYFTRKSAGASDEELRSLLTQMKALYGGKGIDLSLVENELEKMAPEARPALEPRAAPKPAPKPKPAAAPRPKPKETPAVKKAAPAAASPELERAMRYYRESVKRGISDHERIELLEKILMEFGESGAEKVNSELERIRRRVEP